MHSVTLAVKGSGNTKVVLILTGLVYSYSLTF